MSPTSKAARLSPSSRRTLSEATNAALIHTCEYGHDKCALKYRGACADEAAHIVHTEHHKHAAPIQVREHLHIPAGWNIVAAGPAPTSAPMQQALF